MSKKKMITLAIIALLLIVAMLIGGIFAYFTKTTAQLTNTFTIGNVSINLTEPNWNAANATNLTPGANVVKDPTVQNDGSNPAYVFLKVDIPYYNSEQAFTLTGLDTTNWKEISSLTTVDTTNNKKTIVYAYASGTGVSDLTALETTDAAKTLFTGVTLSSDNTTVNAAAAADTLQIIVTGYAIQTNLADTLTTQEAVYNAIVNP